MLASDNGRNVPPHLSLVPIDSGRGKVQTPAGETEHRWSVMEGSMNRSTREASGFNAFDRAREYARSEMAERIAAAFPFSVAEVWLLLDELTEAEARQVCALARRWKIAPVAAAAILDEQTGDIHAVLERRRIKPFRPS